MTASTLQSSNKLILASASLTRQAMLQNAGVGHTAIASNIDEEAVKQAFITDVNQNFADLAVILAQAKGMMIASQNPTCYILAADQILLCDNKIYSKPQNHDQARDQLMALRGKTHQLISAAAIMKNDTVLWSYSDTASLTMRDFSNDFLGRYLADMGEQLCQSVGAYQLEAGGAQLFDHIEGSYFTILGLPLLPVLDYLRKLNLLEI